MVGLRIEQQFRGDELKKIQPQITRILTEFELEIAQSADKKANPSTGLAFLC